MAGFSKSKSTFGSKRSIKPKDNESFSKKKNNISTFKKTREKLEPNSINGGYRVEEAFANTDLQQNKMNNNGYRDPTLADS